uniref:Ion_trans_2 domain-containing protein n=1 Tax=Heterorhabditis bacteriophora TaxID=37862 RepID=A0A1I7WVE8_HETBA
MWTHLEYFHTNPIFRIWSEMVCWAELSLSAISDVVRKGSCSNIVLITSSSIKDGRPERTISTETVLGIWITMLYTTLFCPISMVISRDLGQWALVYITRFYGYIKLKFTSQSTKSLMTGDEQIILPVKYTIPMLLSMSYLSSINLEIPLIMTATFLSYYDTYMGPEPGLTWFESFYFSCQTYTTAGFGDIMPINATFDPVVSTVFFFCLPLQKVVNRMQYLYMENGIHVNIIFIYFIEAGY